MVSFYVLVIHCDQFLVSLFLKGSRHEKKLAHHEYKFRPVSSQDGQTILKCCPNPGFFLPLKKYNNHISAERVVVNVCFGSILNFLISHL